MKRELGNGPFHSDFLHVSRFTFHASRFPCRGEAGLLGNTLQIRVHLCSSVVELLFLGLNGNGYERSMRTGEIGGGFRSATENIRIFSDGDGRRSVRSAMFIVTHTLEARPSSFRSGTEWHFAPTALQWRGRQRDAMPLRWSLADPMASVAINMSLQKELFAA